jgi:pimeloyl-ACP methyl ester carboxylesterase
MILLSLLKIGGTVLVACVALLWFFQTKLIYHPQPYRPDYKRLLPARGQEIEYQTGCGRQTAFYIPPRAAEDPTTVPQRLWVMFGGNGSLALFWSDTVNEVADKNAAFLLVDYPGYGKCAGTPSPVSIRESSDGALDALAAHLECTTEDLERDLNVGGHSLGSAAALQFAVRHPVRRAVLAAPFTSMRAMAKQVVGGGFSMLLRHDYDNDGRLTELAAREQPPQVTIIHGDADRIVPVEMSRSLARAHPSIITYHEVKGADHVSILDDMPEYLAPKSN